jgi:hypothetical protein
MVCQNKTPCIAILKNKNAYFQNKDQEGKTGPVWRLEPVWGADIRKGCGRVNVVEILCIHL